MKRPRSIGIFGGATVLLLLIYLLLSPRPVSGRQAGDLLHRCLSQQRAEKGCHVADGTAWALLGNQAFRLSKSGSGPELVYFDFASPDRQFCAHIEFGTGSLNGYRGADFYRCANRGSVPIGIG